MLPMPTTMFSSPCSLSVATLAFVITFLTATQTLTSAATLGVAYGRYGNNLPPPREVVDLYKSQGIKGMRIYSADQDVLQALRGSDIELIIGPQNERLQEFAQNPSSARTWVQTNVLNYLSDVKIKYIAVGNEVSPVNNNSRFARFLVPAMTNIFNAVRDAGLFQKVIVSTSLDTGVLGISSLPSEGQFRSNVMDFMNAVIGFLTDTRAPIMFSIYPYFAYVDQPRDIELSFALFTNKLPYIDNNNLEYYNLFDAMLDSVYTALEKASGSSLRVVVTETGWPSYGRPGRGQRTLLSAEDAPTIENACTYNRNLIRHVTSSSGTPKRPGTSIETYIFAMFNENLKPPPETEKYFGLFLPNKESKCGINFHES